MNLKLLTFAGVFFNLVDTGSQLIWSTTDWNGFSINSLSYQFVHGVKNRARVAADRGLFKNLPPGDYKQTVCFLTYKEKERRNYSHFIS